MNNSQLFPDLHGYGLNLQALRDDDAADMIDAVQDGALWTLVFAFAPTPQTAGDYIRSAISDPGRHAYAVRDAQGHFLGTSSFYQADTGTRRLLIGYTWFRQSVWRTAVNTSCKLLMMQYAFNEWRANMLAWETDIVNTRSQAAIERLGARKDGVIRGNKLRRDGTVRDTVVYSMSAAEWPQHKARLAARLAQG